MLELETFLRCRLCLRYEELHESIYDPNGTKGLLLWKMIEELLNLPLSKTDGFPPTICRECKEKLVGYHEFREMCINSKMKLLEMMSKRGLVESRANVTGTIPELKDSEIVVIEGNVDSTCENQSSVAGIVSLNPVKSEGVSLIHVEWHDLGSEDEKDDVLMLTPSGDTDGCETLDETPREMSSMATVSEDVGGSGSNENRGVMSDMDNAFCKRPSQSCDASSTTVEPIALPPKVRQLDCSSDGRHALDEGGPCGEKGRARIEKSCTVDNIQLLGHELLQEEETGGERLLIVNAVKEHISSDEHIIEHRISKCRDTDSDVPIRSVSPSCEMDGEGNVGQAANSCVNSAVDGNNEYLKAKVCSSAGDSVVESTVPLPSVDGENSGGVWCESSNTSRSTSRNGLQSPDLVLKDSHVVLSDICKENSSVVHVKWRDDMTKSCDLLKEDLSDCSTEKNTVISTVTITETSGNQFMRDCNSLETVRAENGAKGGECRDPILCEKSMQYGTDYREIIHSCETRGDEFNSRSQVLIHKKIHGAGCTTESQSHRKMLSVESEQVLAVGKRDSKQFLCQYCGKTFMRSWDMRQHERLHTKLKPYECAFCKQRFTSKTHLERHELVHGVMKEYQCEICNKVFKYKASINRHYKMFHMREKPFKCAHCYKAFPDISNLRCHIHSHMGIKAFECTHCDKRYSYRTSLNNHRRIHTEVKPFECTHCDKRFSYITSLRNHLQTHTGLKPFECTHCDKRFSYITSLRNHLQTHTGLKPFECSNCNKKFLLKRGLKRHLLMHTEEKPFECTHCNERFSVKSTLIDHLLTHTGKRPLKCSHCNKRFHQTSHLWRHLLIHEREKSLEEIGLNVKRRKGRRDCSCSH